MHRGGQKRVLTPGYNKRRNTFVTFFWPKRDGFPLQHLPEENEQGVQATPFQPHPACEEAQGEESHPLHRPRSVSQDQECQEVHPRASDTEGEAPAKERTEL